ncbi:M6 family metalloprotease domain-containing protein [Streptomyces sp. NPDC033754]|uniref:M6 family metalloprotease domain-containing protein n=1 Tax=Streptomyces sp. NPDC033754 TaxID=3365318 RepID=UPI00384BD266
MVSRPTDPEVHVRGQQPPGGVERSRARAGAAAFTAFAALAATGLVAGPAVGAPAAHPCALPRTAAHHSLGLDTWNGSYPRPTRSLDAVMIFLSFPDATPLTTPAELTADHFPATSEYFARASYGRFDLRPYPRPGWTPMPRESSAYDIRRDWDSGKRAAYLRDAVAAADADVDFSRYDVVYLVADPDAPGVDSDATKVVNLERPLEVDGKEIKRVVTVFERHPPDRNVLAHETGHVFDLPDLYHRPVDGKGDWDTHVGDWDVMGSQFGLAPDLFGWHKWKLGWLSRAQVTCVQGPGPQVVSLEPTDAPPSESGVLGTRLAVVRTGKDSVLAIEARSSTGNDADTCTEGVLVYRVRNGAASGDGPVQVVDAHPRTEACGDRSVYPPLADAPLEVGETFTVPGTGVRVEVADRTEAGGWTVKVTPPGVG